jgi:hypothetical protein
VITGEAKVGYLLSRRDTVLCCNADRVWFGSTITTWRGKPPIYKAGRKVFHVRGEEVFWHWYDRRHHLVEGYGP